MTIPTSEPREPSSPADNAAERRRFATQSVREARERLTSSTGVGPAFDYELLRQFAQNRLSGSLVVLMLVVSVGVFSSIWSGALTAATWAAAVLAIHAIIIFQCRKFLAEPSRSVDVRKWRLRFIVLDLFFGLAWMFDLIQSAGVQESSGTFNLFVMLLVVAVSSMLASSLPIAVVAATSPVTTAVAANFLLMGNVHGYILAAMAVTAQCYFALLAYRLYYSALATLEARAEKDALIGELEQAKAKSDEARRRAESANIAKSSFLAQMSHELRTPLNAILGFSEVMQNEIFGPHGVPAYKDYASDIHQSGVHLLGLINEILDLSRIEAGRYQINEEAIWLVPVVEECHYLLKLRAKTRGIAIHERDLAQGGLDGGGRSVHQRQRQRPGNSGGGNPDRSRFLRPGLQRHQVGRTGRGSWLADRQESHRSPRRHVHDQIEIARGNRSDRDISMHAHPVGGRAVRDNSSAAAAPGRVFEFDGFIR